MKVKLNDVRLSFPVLFQPKEFKPGDGKPRYSATLLVEPGSENDKAIRAAIQEAAKETWADKAAKMLASVEGQKNQFCYLKGDTKDYDGYQGKMAISCHRRAADGRPTILDQKRAPLTVDDGKPYAGCYVNAIIEVYCQKGENPGVRASFSGIQFVRDGDAFSGNKPASADDFEELAGADAEDFA